MTDRPPRSRAHTKAEVAAAFDRVGEQLVALGAAAGRGSVQLCVYPKPDPTAPQGWTWVPALGYDPQKKRYVGTWIGSMMTHLWIYDGELDASGKVLSLAADGPSFADPTKTAKYKDVIEIKNDGHRILTSHVLGEDGKWTQFMTAHYRRVK